MCLGFCCITLRPVFGSCWTSLKNTYIIKHKNPEHCQVIFLTSHIPRWKEISETKWYLSERKLYWADNSLRQHDVAIEQAPDLSEQAEQSVFWHKHRVQVLMERCCKPVWPSVLQGHPPSSVPLLVRFCLELVVLLVVGKDFFKLIWRSCVEGISIAFNV